jgi:hypothetical protein
MTEQIHICEFKKGKLVEAYENGYGELFCARCGRQVPREQTIYRGKKK